MIRHVWTIYCRELLIDQETNNASLIHTLEQLNFTVEGDEPDLTEVNVIPFDSTLVSAWVRRAWDTPAQSQMRVQFVGPDGSDLLGGLTPIPLDLREHRRLRTISNLKAIGIKGSGIYEWVIERDEEGEWVEEARIPVHVVIEPGTPEGETSAR